MRWKELTKAANAQQVEMAARHEDQLGRAHDSHQAQLASLTSLAEQAKKASEAEAAAKRILDELQSQLRTAEKTVERLSGEKAKGAEQNAKLAKRAEARERELRDAIAETDKMRHDLEEHAKTAAEQLAAAHGGKHHPDDASGHEQRAARRRGRGGGG